jgi:DNA-binding transcriptional ArsR family regulator
LTGLPPTARLPFVNAYQQDVDPLAALGDTTRRAIIDALREGERTVGELAASLPVSRPAVSQHLAILRAAGLVLERPAGTRRWYRLDPIGLVRLHARLDAMWGIDAAPGPAAGTTASRVSAEGVRGGQSAHEPRRGEAKPAAKGRPEVVADAPRDGRKKRKKKGSRK